MTINSLAAETWQHGIYKKINQRMKLHGEEFEEEVVILKGTLEGLQKLRKQLLTERHD